MRLPQADNAFVEKRERRAKYWPVYGLVSLAMVVMYGAWLWLKIPYLINPWYVIEALEARELPETTMSVMAVMLPIVMAAFLVFICAVVLLWFIPFRNERRLIRLVRELEANSDGKK